LRRKSISSKILVIEDDPSFQRYLSHLLEREGYGVVVAANGLDGLRKAKAETPSLILLDVMLPGLDGFEVCNRLKEDTSTAAIPVLMLSAKGQVTDKATALKVGASEFFQKPVDRLVLLEKIAELIGNLKSL
jgi:DNA-binding response OmpR family regulator